MPYKWKSHITLGQLARYAEGSKVKYIHKEVEKANLMPQAVKVAVARLQEIPRFSWGHRRLSHAMLFDDPTTFNSITNRRWRLCDYPKDKVFTDSGKIFDALVKHHRDAFVEIREGRKRFATASPDALLVAQICCDMLYASRAEETRQ